MASIATKKVAEGDTLMQEANKLTTKTLFRWKPDWEGACSLYEKAGTCYKNAKSWDKAKEAYTKAATAFTNINIAAQNYSNAAAMAKEAGLLDECVELYEKAHAIYRQETNPDKAADCLVKAAKIIEDRDKDKAVQLSMDACSIFEEDDREQFASQTFRYSISLLLKNNRIDEAIDLVKRLGSIHEKLKQDHDVHKIYLSLVIIHLHRDDYVAADKTYQDAMNSPSFVGSQECMVAGELLEAFEKRDGEALKSILSKQIFNFLDQQVAKLAKNLKIADSVEGGNKDEGLA